MGTYETLCADRELCQALGRMMLAGSRLESNLRAFLALNGVQVSESQASLGALIDKLRRHDFLSENGVQILRNMKVQRNYLIHSLYDLFAGRIAEGMLLRDELDEPSLLAQMAWVLEQNLNSLSHIAEKRISELKNGKRSGDARLFRP